jgi:purine-binding chemotaxis protein CheW
MRAEARKPFLSVLAGGQRAGLPLASVREIMRPLPIAGVAGAPHFVLGLSVVRGVSLPVVNLGALLGEARVQTDFGRFVRLEFETRSVALAVERVNGVVELDPQALSGMPPLLSRAANELVDMLALHDSALLLVLKTARLVTQLPEINAEVAP